MRLPLLPIAAGLLLVVKSPSARKGGNYSVFTRIIEDCFNVDFGDSLPARENVQVVKFVQDNRVFRGLSFGGFRLNRGPWSQNGAES